MTEKTYKREVACICLLALGAAFVASFWLPHALEVAKTMQAGVWAFVIAAFGLDAYSKQVKQ